MVLAITKEDLLWAYIQIWDISWSSVGFGRMNKFTLVLSVLFSVSDSKLEVAERRWMAWRILLSGRKSLRSRVLTEDHVFVVKGAKLHWYQNIELSFWSLPFCLCLVVLVFCLFVSSIKSHALCPYSSGSEWASYPLRTKVRYMELAGQKRKVWSFTKPRISQVKQPPSSSYKTGEILPEMAENYPKITWKNPTQGGGWFKGYL